MALASHETWTKYVHLRKHAGSGRGTGWQCPGYGARTLAAAAAADDGGGLAGDVGDDSQSDQSLATWL